MTATVQDQTVDAFAREVGASGPVAVAGGRTRWDTGGPVEPGTRIVRAPVGILEHRPEEMTVRVRAGTPVDQLHAELAQSGQRTALPSRGGSVGGALAVGENDLCVLGRGRVRDALLQVRYVSAEGRVVTGGGPTVKNVSGFDLPRLLVGSLGTLGLIAEVILRTNPRPPHTRWLRASGIDPLDVAGRVHKPAAVLWDGTDTWVALEGHGEDVDAGATALGQLGDWVTVGGPPPLPPHRWSLAPAALVAGTASFSSSSSSAPGAPGSFVASIGVGSVFASAPQHRTPALPSMVRLTARMKRQFDPTGRLNPGRQVLAA